MDNQHKKIKGYRDLTQDEINLMNEVKSLASEVEKVVFKLNGLYVESANRMIDPRWVSIGATDLQTGFMALIRAIAQPESF